MSDGSVKLARVDHQKAMDINRCETMHRVDFVFNDGQQVLFIVGTDSDRASIARMLRQLADKVESL